MNPREYLKQRLEEYMPTHGAAIEARVFDLLSARSIAAGKGGGWDFYPFRKEYRDAASAILTNLAMEAGALRKNCRDVDVVLEMVATMIRDGSTQSWEPVLWPTVTSHEGSAPISVEDREDGIFRCRRCNSLKTAHTEFQTRSSDEPTTIFANCFNCMHRWRFSG